jgi:hypothetical protein
LERSCALRSDDTEAIWSVHWWLRSIRPKKIGQQVEGHAGYKTCCPDLSQFEGHSAFVPEGFLVTQTSVVSSRQRSQGGLVHLVNGCRGGAEFGGDHVDRVLADVEVYPTVGGGRGSVKVRADVRCTTFCGYPQADLVAQKSCRDIPPQYSRQRSSAHDRPSPPDSPRLTRVTTKRCPRSGLCGVARGFLNSDCKFGFANCNPSWLGVPLVLHVKSP